MGQTFTLPDSFPGLDDVEPGEKKKFLIEAELAEGDGDDDKEWEIVSVDGVKLPEDPDQNDDDTDGAMSDYDDSQDESNPDEGTEPDEDVTPSGKAKTTKGIGILIMHGKPK